MFISQLAQGKRYFLNFLDVYISAKEVEMQFLNIFFLANQFR